MDQIFLRVAEKCGKADFLEALREKAHYSEEDRELFWNVAEQILACMENEAVVSAKNLTDVQGEAYAQEVVMTLGAGVDALQEDFLKKGQITEAYMVEVLGSEILLQAYTVYNTWVREQGEYVVKRYHFLGTEGNFTKKEIGGTEGSGDEVGSGVEEGSGDEVGSGVEEGSRDEVGSGVEEGSGDKVGSGVTEGAKDEGKGISLGLEALPEVLKRSGLPVTCTEGYCMVPKKSVAFYAELTKDKTVNCEGICTGCGRADCPNRMSLGTNPRGNRMLDRPLTYGYARILGL